MTSTKRKHPTSVSAVSSDPLDLSSQIESRKALLTVPELAEFLHLSCKQIYALTARGLIPSHRIAGSIRYDPHLVAKWLRSQAP